MICSAGKSRTILLLIAMLLIGSRLEAARLRVLVLNGKDGKPASGRTVEILTPGPSAAPLVKGKTDQQGFFEIGTDVLPDRVSVYVKGRLLCKGSRIGTSIQSIKEILSHGVVESNDCNNSVTHAQEPGLLILFVRHENLSEILD
jgi:hypothetical protein